MKNNLPSLNSIRFFECAARHLSFTRAAEELYVTQGAVSKQIKLLEEQLACQLFSRKGPNLSLTKHGEELFSSVNYALETIQQSVGKLRRNSGSVLTLSVLPSFASIWLMPKIVEFETENPDISVRQTASFVNVDFNISTDIDAAIRLGRGNWDGLYTRQLTRDSMIPVCNKATAKSIKSIADFSNQTLLIDPNPQAHKSSPNILSSTQQSFGEWELWFEAANETCEINDFRIIDEVSTLIRAALIGKGIALLREELVSEYLESGFLVRLFDVEFYSELHYYFVCPLERKDETKISLFRHWLEKVSH